MTSVLIVYGSGEGQTAKVAEHVGEQIRRRGYIVDVLNGKRLPRGFDIDRYDGIIVAASVRMMKFQRYIVAFARKYRDRLGAVPSAFVSVSMAAAHNGDPAGGFQQEWLDRFIKESGWKPARFASFGGALMYRKYNFITRMVMKRIAQRGGLTTDTSRNHEFTDWDAVNGFADEFADGLVTSRI